MTQLIFCIPPEEKLEMARRAVSGAGNRKTSGVATKEQIALLHTSVKYENVAFVCKAVAVPDAVAIYDLDNCNLMKTLQPENWLSCPRYLEEFLNISDYPMLAAICEVPKLVKVSLYRELDTVQMKVTFYLPDKQAIEIYLEPGVTLLTLMDAPSVAIKLGNLESNRVLGNGREVYLLPDERSEVKGILNDGDKVEIMNDQDVYDAETGVEWVNVRSGETFGWMPKAAISQFSVLFGDNTVKMQEMLDSTLHQSVLYSENESAQQILEIHKRTLAAIFESILAEPLKLVLTETVLNSATG